MKAQLLLVGAILSPRKRTVTSALRAVGLSDEASFAKYHHVLSRAVWSPLQLSRVLLMLLIRHLAREAEPLVFSIEETLERRWGSRISAKGIFRDAVRSTRDPHGQDQRAALDKPDVAGEHTMGASNLGSTGSDRSGSV